MRTASPALSPLALSLLAFAGCSLFGSTGNAAPEACQWVAEGAPLARNAFADALARGPLYAFLITWVFGLGVALTPCVYPMIAVTVSIFGARQARSRWQGAGLSLVFVLGIVALFVPLGIMAARTGALMGAWLQNPWVFTAIGALFLVMAASLFGAFELALPDRLQARLTEVGGVGYRGAFALGLVSGLVATPCTGPFLTSLIVWIGQSQNTLLGVVMMTAFGLGLGTPFFIVGTTAMQLPKSGKWMLHVKTALGIVLVVAALYYLGNGWPVLTSGVPAGIAFAVGMGAVAIVGLGLVVAATRSRGRLAVGLKATGIALLSLGAYLCIVGALRPVPGEAIAWQPLGVAEARARALAESRPLLVDFTAQWCIACGELDRHTFSDPGVVAATERFVAVKVDLTADDELAAKAKDEFRIVGLPTVLLFDSSGREVVRCNDFLPADEFRPFVERVE